MTEDSQEEGIVPAGALDFEAYGCARGMGTQDIERESAHDGEVLGRIVLACAIGVLGEMDVEEPTGSPRLVVHIPARQRRYFQDLRVQSCNFRA